MKKHFVRFYSPGTIVSEITTRPIDSWDVDKAKAMALNIEERYKAIPYGFRFITRSRLVDELDSQISNESPMYFLGGTIKTLDQIKKENNPDNNILIFNMECNKYNRVIINTNSWKMTLPLGKDDIVL